TSSDSCTSGVCGGSNIPGCCRGDADCNDGVACNGAETCNVSTGECGPGTPVNCDDGDTCTTDACNEPNGQCSNTPIPLNPLDVSSVLCFVSNLLGGFTQPPPTPTPGRTATPTATPTAIVAPTTTATQTASPTFTPTSTQTPTATATPTGTATVTPTAT